jgi:hypothetical protein
LDSITPREEFLAGSREVAPSLVGTVPFGVVVGVAGVAAGMTAVQTVALSVLAFSGIAQLIACQLIAVQSPVLLTMAAASVVSLRLLMYSAALAPAPRAPRPALAPAAVLRHDRPELRHDRAPLRATRRAALEALAFHGVGHDALRLLAARRWSPARSRAPGVPGGLVARLRRWCSPFVALPRAGRAHTGGPGRRRLVAGTPRDRGRRASPIRLSLIVGSVAGIALGMALDISRRTRGR